MRLWTFTDFRVAASIAFVAICASACASGHEPDEFANPVEGAPRHIFARPIGAHYAELPTRSQSPIGVLPPRQEFPQFTITPPTTTAPNDSGGSQGVPLPGTPVPGTPPQTSVPGGVNPPGVAPRQRAASPTPPTALPPAAANPTPPAAAGVPVDGTGTGTGGNVTPKP